MSYTPRNNRPGYRKIAQPEGHNTAQFLDIVWLWSRAHWRQLYDDGGYEYRPKGGAFPPGWYVVRICDCHRGEMVIWRTYASKEQALAGVRLLVNAAMEFDT